MKKQEINETFNQIILKIASGVNYASELAKDIGKSIPVTFRQLDELIEKDILKKERKGKKVEYHLQWNSIAESLVNFIEEEFSRSKKILSLNIKPISKTETKKIIEDILEIDYIQETFKKTYKEIENAGKISQEYTKIKFNQALAIFLESFGELDDNKKKKLLDKIPKNKQKEFNKFLEISEIHKKIINFIDPRKKIF